MLTAEQRKALYLPATRALLDGWCGPVVLDEHDTVFRGLHGRAQVFSEAYDASDEDAWVALADIAPSRLRLDLSRAEVRDRVARVVTGGHEWWLCVGERWVRPIAVDHDPNDDTRLPDGSRWVDALALAAVAREVLRG